MTVPVDRAFPRLHSQLKRRTAGDDKQGVTGRKVSWCSKLIRTEIQNQ
jgi:hypothetical protein